VEDRIRVEDEAKQYVEQWEETVEMMTNFTIRPVTPLRHLLAEYHDICERILDEHEIVAGVMADRIRAQKRRRPASLQDLGICETAERCVGFGRTSQPHPDRLPLIKAAPATPPF
jgi:hypothetical protein